MCAFALFPDAACSAEEAAAELLRELLLPQRHLYDKQIQGKPSSPSITIKCAATLDGKLATGPLAKGKAQSHWISGSAARRHAHCLRAAHDGVLVGIHTLQADDPRLTVRLGGEEARSEQARAHPARIVLDSQALTPWSARFLAADARRIIVVGSAAPSERIAALQARGAEVLQCPTERPQPAEFLPQLRERGLHSLLVEGGAEVHASLIGGGWAQVLVLYLAARIMGEADAPAWCATAFRGMPLAERPTLQLQAVQRLGEDLCIVGVFEPRCEKAQP